jgi:hypothetical protein
MELQTLFRRESAAETFLKETDNITHPLFPDPNNGAIFVPESETSIAGSGKLPGFLLVCLKMADKKNKKVFFSLFRIRSFKSSF